MCHPVLSKAQALSSAFSCLIDWVVINFLVFVSLNFRLALDARPASVQTTIVERLKSSIIFFSNGCKVVCSLVFPGFMENARGIPSPSINKPI